jgi:hypothetical protein
MDPDAVARHPDNAVVVRLVGEGARARPGSAYAIDGYELRAHPDLEERLRQLNTGTGGGSVVGFRGYPVILDPAGVVRVLATGTSGLLLRLAEGPERDAIIALGGGPAPELGPGWTRADPWLSDVPATEGSARLRGCIAAALAGSHAGPPAASATGGPGL